MNTVSILISILIVVVLVASVFHSMWHLSKKLVIPMQICLFILLLVLLFKTFATKENFNRLNEQVEKSGIVDIEVKTVKDSVKAVDEMIKNDAEPVVRQSQKQDTVSPKKEEKNEKKEITDFTQFMK